MFSIIFHVGTPEGRKEDVNILNETAVEGTFSGSYLHGKPDDIKSAEQKTNKGDTKLVPNHEMASANLEVASIDVEMALSGHEVTSTNCTHAVAPTDFEIAPQCKHTGSKKASPQEQLDSMAWHHWLHEPQFYQVGVLEFL